jgi:hypothetical protein
MNFFDEIIVTGSKCNWIKSNCFLNELTRKSCLKCFYCDKFEIWNLKFEDRGHISIVVDTRSCLETNVMFLWHEVQRQFSFELKYLEQHPISLSYFIRTTWYLFCWRNTQVKLSFGK